MLADEIQAGFPAGTSLPAELRRLCEFSDQHGREISGNFEFETDGQNEALAAFDGDEAAASRFAVFGRGPDGSLYAFWLYEGSDAFRAPVVLLDSESDGNAVIAADAKDFVRLLAIGYSEPGQYPTLEPDDVESADELREWVIETEGLDVPEMAAELVAAAQSRHPNLEAWIRDWQNRRYG